MTPPVYDLMDKLAAEFAMHMLETEGMRETAGRASPAEVQELVALTGRAFRSHAAAIIGVLKAAMQEEVFRS